MKMIKIVIVLLMQTSNIFAVTTNELPQIQFLNMRGEPIARPKLSDKAYELVYDYIKNSPSDPAPDPVKSTEPLGFKSQVIWKLPELNPKHLRERYPPARLSTLE